MYWLEYMSSASPVCLLLFRQLMVCARARAPFSAGSIIAARIAIIAITMSSSRRVNFVMIGLKRRYAGGVSAAPRTPCVRQGAGAAYRAVQCKDAVGRRWEEDPQ